MSFRARKKKTEGYDLGFVGEICSVEPRWLEAIWNEGGIPVLSSLALGSDGEYYNVNADQMAAACAVACHADTLIFLTDVPGVKDADGSVIPWLNTKDVAAMVEHSVIGGGMLPKLEACNPGAQKGSGPRADSAGGASRDLAAVLLHQAGVRHGGDWGMNLASVVQSEQEVLLPTYDRQRVLFTRGPGRLSVGFGRQALSRLPERARRECAGSRASERSRSRAEAPGGAADSRFQSVSSTNIRRSWPSG